MEAPNAFYKKRLTTSNIKKYLLSKYNNMKYSSAFIVDRKVLDFTAFLQKNYGEANDCTLTCIMASVIYHSLNSLKDEEVYPVVESIAKNYFYDGTKMGTIPIFIKTIYDKVLKHFGIKISTKRAYLKCLGFNLQTIKKAIDNGKPVIFSIFNDGRDYYTNHSITIIGYETYKLTDGYRNSCEDTMLLVYDNWYNNFAYVDLETVSLFSAINY